MFIPHYCMISCDEKTRYLIIFSPFIYSFFQSAKYTHCITFVLIKNWTIKILVRKKKGYYIVLSRKAIDINSIYVFIITFLNWNVIENYFLLSLFFDEERKYIIIRCEHWYSMAERIIISYFISKTNGNFYCVMVVFNRLSNIKNLNMNQVVFCKSLSIKLFLVYSITLNWSRIMG